VSTQTLEDDEARVKSAAAGVAASKAQVQAAKAAVEAAQAQVTGAESQGEAVQATIARIEADLEDSVLKAPRAGRVQYKIAQPGEVLGAGGKVLNLVDLGDVYLTFFLPEIAAGRLALGAEARLVLDAAPQYVVPARISFVASVAQFTPKTVETLTPTFSNTRPRITDMTPPPPSGRVQAVRSNLPGGRSRCGPWRNSSSIASNSAQMRSRRVSNQARAGPARGWSAGAGAGAAAAVGSCIECSFSAAGGMDTLRGAPL